MHSFVPKCAFPFRGTQIEIVLDKKRYGEEFWVRRDQLSQALGYSIETLTVLHRKNRPSSGRHSRRCRHPVTNTSFILYSSRALFGICMALPDIELSFRLIDWISDVRDLLDEVFLHPLA